MRPSLAHYPSSRIAWRIMTLLIAAGILVGCAQTPSRPAPERKTSADSARIEVPEPAQIPAPVIDHSPAAPAAGPDTRALTIQIGNQHFVYSEGDRVVRTGPISSGREGQETPRGQFSVLSKDEHKVSSRYTNQLGWQAWMPYAIQFNGHYFLHEGWLPGYPDSAGCVRVGEKDARFLFERIQLGDPVSVVD